MHVLLDCGNYNNLLQHTFKKIKTTDNIEFDISNKLAIRFFLGQE